MPPPFRYRPVVEPLGATLAELPLADLAARLASGTLVWLDGWPAGASVLAFAPLRTRTPRSLAGLRRCVAQLAPESGDPVPGGFQGGFLGALAYELGAAAEPGLRLPPDPWGLPPILGGLFTDFLVRDPSSAATYLVLGEGTLDGRAPVAERRRALLARLERPRALEPLVARGALRRGTEPAEHARRIRSARAWIEAGEFYQANLSHRSTQDVSGEPLELYTRLRALHPAPRAGFLRAARAALLSVSPELLLEYAVGDRGARARTRPIKGTAARAQDPVEDRARVAALLASAKDRAELAMIVDLERNDLGRVAVPGGVEVRGFPSVESYASVHHLAADVVARPRPEVDALACLAALFPGGSVTGAPKLRSMEAIAALEGEGRGFAYGSLLALDTHGRLEASLLIRTLLWRPRRPAGAGEVSFRVGGGITWGSEPEAEWAEAEAKGRALARALAGAGPGSLWLPEPANALL